MILTLLLLVTVGAFPEDSVHISFDSGVEGILFPFWDTQPRPGDAMRVDRGWLTLNNSALIEDAVPWWNWPAPLTDPFTSFVSTVRLLGDLPNATGDIVHGKQCGIFDWPLFNKRMNFTNIGMQPFLVWDNVPFCFVKHPVIATYGQVAPPDNETEWGTFITSVSQYLQNHYSTHSPSRWRYRVGTEPNNPGHFSGNEEAYFKHYDHTVCSLRKVFPAAKIGPGNMCPAHKCVLPHLFLEKFVQHMVNGTNYCTGQVGGVFSWLSYSVYGSYKNDGSGYDPLVAQTASGVMRNVKSTLPHHLQKSITLEFQEFGTLGNEQGIRSSEPGAFGGAWTAAMYIRGALEGGVDKIFHWSTLDTITEVHRVLTSNAWLHSLLQYVIDYEAENPKFTIGRPHYVGGDISGLNVTSVYFQSTVKKDRAFLLLSAFYIHRKQYRTQVLTIALPNHEPAWKKVTARCLNTNSSVFDVVLSDATRESPQKYLKHHDGLMYPFGDMLTPAGRMWLYSNADHYWHVFVESLRPTTLPIWDGTFRLDTPSTCLLEFSLG